jgi:ubiquitin-protein ligase
MNTIETNEKECLCTKEDMEKLLNEKKNDLNFGYDVDYYDEKEKNPFEWKVLLEGTQGSIYEGGFYMLKVIFPKNYPKSKPSAYFLNKIFHPHIYKGDSWNGCCCIKPIGNDIKSVLDAVSNMFIDHNADYDHAYGEEPRQLLEQNKEDEFIQKAKDWVREYAKLEDIEIYM